MEEEVLYKQNLLTERRTRNELLSSLPNANSNDDAITTFINSIIKRKYETKGLRTIQDLKDRGSDRQKRFTELIADAIRMIKYLTTYEPQMERSLYAKMMFGYVKNLILDDTDYAAYKRKYQNVKIGKYVPLQMTHINNQQILEYLQNPLPNVTLEINGKKTIRITGSAYNRDNLLKSKTGSLYYLYLLVKQHNAYTRKVNNIAKLVDDPTYDAKKFNRRFLKAAVTGRGGFKQLLNNAASFQTYNGDIYSYATVENQRTLASQADNLVKQQTKNLNEKIASRTDRYNHYKDIIDNYKRQQTRLVVANQNANNNNQGAGGQGEQMEQPPVLISDDDYFGESLPNEYPRYTRTAGTELANAYITFRDQLDGTAKRPYITEIRTILNIGRSNQTYAALTDLQKQQIIITLRTLLTPLQLLPQVAAIKSVAYMYRRDQSINLDQFRERMAQSATGVNPIVF